MARTRRTGQKHKPCCLRCYNAEFTRTWGAGIDPIKTETMRYPKPKPCQLCGDPTNWFLDYHKHPPDHSGLPLHGE